MTELPLASPKLRVHLLGERVAGRMNARSDAAVVSRRQAVSGDGLLHPLALAAVVVLVVNDHALKAAWPGPVTGKVSDFAGLLYFPLFLQALLEVALRGRSIVADRRVGMVCIVATGVIFASIKTMPAATEFYGFALGWLQWMAGALPAALTGAPFAIPHRVSVAMDPTDLIALPMLLVTYRLMKRRAWDLVT